MNELDEALEALRKSQALCDAATDLVGQVGTIVEEEVTRAMAVATAQAGARIRARLDRMTKAMNARLEGK